MHEYVAQTLESSFERNQGEAHIELDTEFARFTLKVRVDFHGYQRSRRQFGMGAQVDLLHQIEQSHVVRMLIEGRTGADGEQIAPWHGASLTPECAKLHGYSRNGAQAHEI